MQYRPELTRELYTAIGRNDAYRLGNLLQHVRSLKGLVAAIPVQYLHGQFVEGGKIVIDAKFLADHTPRLEAACVEHLEGRATIDRVEGWDSVGVFAPVQA